MKKFLLTLLVSCACLFSAPAANIKLEWDQFPQGTDLADLSVRIYERFVTEGVTNHVYIGFVIATTTIIDLGEVAPAKHTWVATAYSAFWKAESAYSDEVSTPGAPPVPTTLRIKWTAPTAKVEVEGAKAGYVYDVQSSSDLLAWHSVATFVPAYDSPLVLNVPASLDVEAFRVATF